jgi:hypothetical protein
VSGDGTACKGRDDGERGHGFPGFHGMSSN